LTLPSLFGSAINVTVLATAHMRCEGRCIKIVNPGIQHGFKDNLVN